MYRGRNQEQAAKVRDGPTGTWTRTRTKTGTSPSSVGKRNSQPRALAIGRLASVIYNKNTYSLLLPSPGQPQSIPSRRLPLASDGSQKPPLRPTTHPPHHTAPSKTPNDQPEL
ncbi:hypothetical protein EVG20_g10933 [Dentipellis fragilis]|uniref:Uncharacterized protein n=1 Tax=Dentipellis fragilis TaxID=205917 RepID=A0A4Y9XPC2_9AGAM|nr:hypothetical protein EVG20_g10933 [Dentipellis fragilis]